MLVVQQEIADRSANQGQAILTRRRRQQGPEASRNIWQIQDVK
jgi:hypothetical protein